MACTLESNDFRARITQWRDIIGHASVKRISGGVAIAVPNGLAVGLTALVVAEQECCAFLDFVMTFAADGVELTVTAPPDGQSTIDELVGFTTEPA